jgi:hypothetical protein
MRINWGKHIIWINAANDSPKRQETRTQIKGKSSTIDRADKNK